MWSCTTNANLLLVSASCSYEPVAISIRRCAALKIFCVLIVWVCAVLVFVDRTKEYAATAVYSDKGLFALFIVYRSLGSVKYYLREVSIEFGYYF